MLPHLLEQFAEITALLAIAYGLYLVKCALRIDLFPGIHLPRPKGVVRRLRAVIAWLQQVAAREAGPP